MTESPDQLTVRVVLKPTTAAPPLSSVGYRWDRIVGAAVVASGLLVLSIWMYSSSDSTSVDGADQLVDAVGAAGDRVASTALAPDSVPVSQPESLPESKLEAAPEPTPDAQSEPKPSPAEPAQQSDPRAELAQSSEQLASEPLQTAVLESAAADLVAVTPQQLEPETASVDPVADTAQPRQSSPASDEVSSNDTARRSVLRSPPVTAISTRILSPQVKRFLITDAVASREPVGDASAIREDKKVKGLVKVIAYSEVDGRAGDTLRYLWLRRDKVVANVPVRVGSDSWRSYTSKFLNADMRGHWWVELQTSDGELLAVTEFEY